MYSVLISPLSISAQKTQLIVVPDGKLYLLSFESLMDSFGQYLISSNVVSYATSASLFEFLRTRKPIHPPSKDMLAMGDVPYRDESHVLLASTSWSHRVVRGFADLFGANLDNLPATRDEVLAVNKDAGNKSTLLLGDQVRSKGKARTTTDSAL